MMVLLNEFLNESADDTKSMQRVNLILYKVAKRVCLNINPLLKNKSFDAFEISCI